MSDILESSENYRVSLDYDPFAEEPYDEGSWPIVRASKGGYAIHAEHIDHSKHNRRADERVEAAIRTWGTPSYNDWPKVEKYLRAYFGVTRVHYFSSADYWYITYDSADWREYVSPCGPGWRPSESENPLAEIQAWVLGEVYCYTVERRVREETVTRDTDGTEIRRTERDAWESVDSCCGFYGYEYAKESALEAYRHSLDAGN